MSSKPRAKARPDIAFLAMREAQRMRHSLQAQARAQAGKPNLRLHMVPVGPSRTDGNNIWVVPPLELGYHLEHDRRMCHQYDRTGSSLCDACRMREIVQYRLEHELSHITQGTFEQISPEDFEDLSDQLFERYIAKYPPPEDATDYEQESYKWRVRSKLGNVFVKSPGGPGFKLSEQGYMMLARVYSPWLPGLVNALEDARVNASLHAIKPGTRRYFQAITYSYLDEGFTTPGDPEPREFRELDVEMQLSCLAYFSAAGYTEDLDLADYFSDDAVEIILEDPEVAGLVAQARDASSVTEIFHLARGVLAGIQRHGYMPDPAPPELQQVPDEDDEEADQEADQGPGEADQDQAQGASQEADQEAPEADQGQAQEADQGEAQEAPEADQEADQGQAQEAPEEADQEAQEAPEADQGQGQGQEADQEAPEEADQGQGEPAEDEGNDSEAADQDGTDPGDDDADDPGQGEATEQTETDGQGATSDDDGTDDDCGGDEGEGDGDSDELGDADPDDDSDGTGAGSNPGGGGSSGAGPVQDGSDPGDADADSEGEADDEGGEGEADGAQGSGGQAGGSEPDEESADDPQDDESVRDGEDPAASEPGAEDGEAGEPEPEPPSEQEINDRARDALRVLNQVGGHDERNAFLDDPEPELDLNPGATDDAEDEDENPYGVGEDEEEDVPSDQTEHDGPRPPMMAAALAMAIGGVQAGWFQGPSMAVAGIEFFRLDGHWPSWHSHYQKIESEWHRLKAGGHPVPVDPTQYVNPQVSPTRLAFTENKSVKDQRGLKRGRVHSQTVGQRLITGDPNIFRKKEIPNQRNYAVIVAGDFSASTARYLRGGKHVMELTKEMMWAQALLLHRLGISFSVYGHTAEVLNDDLYRALTSIGDNWDSGYSQVFDEVKSFSDPWNAEALMRLQAIQPCGTNYDGHNLEVYWKLLEREKATHRLLIYYTDGEMPAANFDEEETVMRRMIQQFERTPGWSLLMVGAGTDSPKQYGVDTVEVWGAEDLPKVTRALARKLAEM